MEDRMSVYEGDITGLSVDAIVNAANSSLLGGGGVDGAIHKAAGPQLLAECKTLGGCPTGEARITRGYDLPAKYVIHAVGPVWKGGSANEANLLADCYRNSLNLAQENELKTIAFPAISTGAYGFPPKRAAGIAVHVVRKYLAEPGCAIERVKFAAFGAQTTKLYEKQLYVPELVIWPKSDDEDNR